MQDQTSPILANHSSLTPIPVFINPGSGSYDAMLPILKTYQELVIRELSPSEIPTAIEAEVKAGTPRVIVCGGDGTLALAASKLVNTQTAMAVLAGGTLNHFAGNLGIPTEPKEALAVAIHSSNTTQVDVGYVNEQLFLNTSSVGIYVRFVKTREHLEKRMSYRWASIIAGMRRLIRLRSSRLWVNEEKIRSPLVFVGVRERELTFPALGQEREDGQKGLHVITVRVSNRWDMLKLTLNAMFRGIDPLTRAKQVDNIMVKSITINNHKRKKGLYVATDGEISIQPTPLRYRYEHDALKVVIPPPAVDVPT